MGRKLLVLIGIVTLIASCVVYIDQRYFFNPVVFSKDAITPHSWSDYERPLTLTYYSLDGEERTSYRVEQEGDIRQFLKAMKNSPQAQETKETTEINGALKLKSNNDTLLEVYFYSDYWHVLKQDRSIYQVTQALKRLIDKL
ncbi:hypothetical protein [Halobacillus litoralis]|uniref:hypothetical protein n=1 Tax=Halobacillus litoralis TaxID=45668 RepID=UPI00249171B4|nr:hypothetical protein [Halobacillus litoralis]